MSALGPRNDREMRNFARGPRPFSFRRWSNKVFRAIEGPISFSLRTMRAQRSGLTQHPIIADDCNAAGERGFNAAIANPALECLESNQSRQGIRGIGFSLDEMNKGVILEPQRKITYALGFGGFQFGEHA
jgi:hypothetical protein